MTNVDDVNELPAIAELVLRISALVFTAGNLLAIGLETDARAVLVPLRDARFLIVTIALDWVFCPFLGWLIIQTLPIAHDYATGLLLVGVAPAAPFLPIMIRRAGGDMAYAAAFMSLGAAGTIVFLPAAVLLMLPDLALDPIRLLVPMLVLVLLPLAAGIALKTLAPAAAERTLHVVRPAASLATIVLLISIFVVHLNGFVAAVGSYAILAQLIFTVGCVALGHAASAGMMARRRSVLALGAGTRNLGAALVPLLVSHSDERAVVMVALAVPITLLVTWLAAGVLSRQTAAAEPQDEQEENPPVPR